MSAIRFYGERMNKECDLSKVIDIMQNTTGISVRTSPSCFYLNEVYESSGLIVGIGSIKEQFNSMIYTISKDVISESLLVGYNLSISDYDCPNYMNYDFKKIWERQ